MLNLKMLLALVLVGTLLFPMRFEKQWLFFESLSMLEPVLIILFSGVIPAAALRGSLYVGDQRMFTFLMLPVIFAVISLMWSVDVAATGKSVIVYGSALAAYVVVINIFKGIPVETILKGILISVWILLATAIFSYLPGSPLAPEILYPELVHSGFIFSYRTRLSHPFLGLSNSFATILVMLLPLVFAARRLGVWPRRSFGTGMVVIVAILATGSRGVILAMVIAFGAGWLHRAFTARKLPRGLIAGVCVIICLAASLFFFNLETSRFWDDRFRTATVEARLDAFSAAMQSTSQNHLLGVGSGVSLNAVSDDPLRSVHNAYLQNVLWFGVVGGVVLSVAMWLLPWLAWRINTYTGQACIVKRALAMSILLLLLVNMSQASWEGSVLRVWIYVVVGVGVVLIRGLGEFRARIPAQ